MLEVGLVRGRLPLEVTFRVSLAEVLLDTVWMVVSAPRVEGFEQWIYATHAALSPGLRADADAIHALLGKSSALTLAIHRTPPDDPIHRDAESFIAWLEGLSEADVDRFVRATLDALAAHCAQERDSALPPPSPDDVETLRQCFLEWLDEGQTERVIALARDPAALRTCLVSAVTRFWEQFYRDEYRDALPLMERSVAYHRRQKYAADFDAVFTAVTGRRPPRECGDCAELATLIFVPSVHIGPYVMLHRVDGPFPSLVLLYNCRPTGAPESVPASAVQDLFPPLKALADETRLQILSILDGRELYAQEIVDRLGISQSAVSRHLQLMVSGGVLAVRREERMKYFSVNEEMLAALAAKLKGFRGKKEA